VGGIPHFIIYRIRQIESLRGQGFDHIVKGYFKNRVGRQYVERGDYHVLQPESSEIISRLEFASTVKAGMVLEMSIILRRETYQDNEKKCPRCHHLNLVATLHGCWIEW
jgi:hypothetical protein